MARGLCLLVQLVFELFRAWLRVWLVLVQEDSERKCWKGECRPRLPRTRRPWKQFLTQQQLLVQDAEMRILPDFPACQTPGPQRQSRHRTFRTATQFPMSLGRIQLTLARGLQLHRQVPTFQWPSAIHEVNHQPIRRSRRVPRPVRWQLPASLPAQARAFVQQQVPLPIQEPSVIPPARVRHTPAWATFSR